MPVRRVPLGRQSLTGRVPTTKAGGSVEFESSLERDYITLLVFDWAVIRFEAQPCRIAWTSANGRLRHYVPDFYVQYRRDPETSLSRCDLLCEIKYRNDLAKNWKHYKDKFKAARRYARERGWCFRILTDREIRTPYLDNARFLLQYRHLPAYLSSEAPIRKTLFEFQQTNPATLLAALSLDEQHRSVLLPYIWKLIGSGTIGCDLTQRLTMTSLIWLAEDRLEVRQ